MNLKAQIPWKSLLVQGAVVMFSILSAFTVDAWWLDRQNAKIEQEHLRSLHRDFIIAKERADDSLRVAERCHDDIMRLFMAINARKTAALGRRAFLLMAKAVEYEVFSAPRGAYDAMVNAGEVKLLQSHALKQSLADFYGGFEDARVSEQQLLQAVLTFQVSDVFAQKINWMELGYSLNHRDEPIGDRLKAILTAWQGDRAIGNWLCTLAAHQDTVAEDYKFLVSRIDAILKGLADATKPKDMN